MKSIIFAASILSCSISAFADGGIAVRCKDSAGNAETVMVDVARFKAGVLKLYSHDGTGVTVEEKSYDSSYSCIVESVIKSQRL